jgi:type VI secretion system protein ImpC
MRRETNVADTKAEPETELKNLFATARLLKADASLSDLAEEDQIRGLNMVKEFGDTVNEVSTQEKADPNLFKIIQSKIDELDRDIAEGLNEVLHLDKFQKLEATWRALHYLVFNTETSSRLKLRVLDVTETEMRDDLEKALDFDQSALFKKIYEEEYGTLGGKPYGCLVADIAINRSAPSLSLLKKLASVAAAAHAPLIAAADAKLFDLEGFDELPNPRDVAKIFESSDMAEWNAFRESEDSRYVTLTLPRVLMRLPYHPVDNPVDGLSFKEDVGDEYKPDNELFVLEPANGNAPADPKKVLEAKKLVDEDRLRLKPKPKNYLWGNPAFVLAQRITEAFAMYSWTAAIRGVEGGGKVEGLPLHKFKSLNGDKAVIVPTEVSITDRREKELSDQGFVSLVYCKDTNYAAFFGSQTVNKPKKYNLPAANSNAELSARLPYILNTSRFAHYIKVMMRNRVGSFMTKENVQTYLTTWISDYVLDKDDAGQELKAKYPLREARIDVSDVPGQPGSYSATVFLRPHFQLEGLSASLRLVAELPAAAA